ncbi:thioredoxin domain-containing protein [Corynebacterium breve]|uniref:Thioredoxin domain-containing protein n=1 Tax=Corynebacterium breve TaxID=3049799 RepID=A0ABY8VI98_9CORY|nr:thioredoxin domain-containing protein [Corynebacterium breve]WIM67968.1 thioredoxin domain-containing protein [Corynebacterium breve]
MAETTQTTKIPALMWAFTIVLALAAAVGGYFIGFSEGKAQAPANSLATQESPAADTAEATEIPDVEPGKEFTEPQPNDDGTFNAQLHGPGIEGEQVARRDPNDPFAKGAVDAPIVLSEFSDFGCPFCARFATDTEAELVQEYVDTGLVRVEWNDFTINGPNSEAAARAARAAAEQGKFFEFKDALFGDFDVNGGQPYTIDILAGYAEEAGVKDIEKFKKDAESDKYDDAIGGAKEFAASLGMNGTPSFVIGTQTMSGALPLEEFQKVINTELAKSQDKA